MTPQSEKLLAGLKSESADERYTAWISATGADPEVIPEIAKLLESSKPGERKAADEALKKVVHSVGRETGGARRAQVVKALLALTGDKQPKWTRTVALRHLSTVGGDETVEAAAQILREPELQEEAVFCVERIPGAAADRVLMAAFTDVKDDFKPRILAALGHRRIAAAARMCSDAMGSSDSTVAMAAMKALARIGRSPGGKQGVPDYNTLSDWQKIEFSDSVLRYADGMVASGNPAEAFTLYKLALDRGEEHLQCAAILGLGKIQTPEATALIEARLQSPNRNVRITAQRVKAGANRL